MGRRFRFVVGIGAAAVCVLCCAVSCFVYLYVSCTGAPAPWNGEEHVIITNLPPGTRFVAITAEKSGKLECMDWRFRTSYGSIRQIPAAEAYWDKSEIQGSKVDQVVYWRRGDRYGVVTYEGSGKWRITWFGPEVAGFSTAAFDVTQGQTVPLANEQLKALGLNDVMAGKNWTEPEDGK